MKTEDNDKAQLMRDKARENAAFYYPKTIEGLEAAVKTMAEAHKLAMEVEHSKVRELERDKNAHIECSASALKRVKYLEVQCGELEAQLAQAQAVREEIILTRDERLKKLGWLSPDETAKLQAQCTEARHNQNGNQK